MQQERIRKKIAELNDAVTLSHATRVTKKAGDDGLYIAHQAGAQPSVEESLDLLGLHLKYLLFDLEATRRENRYLRQMLETRPPRSPEEDHGAEPGL